MKESFGGAFMIKLVLIFIVIYVSFMAIAINYAKAFRVKNGVINIIEENQYAGTYEDKMKIDNYLANFGYYYPNRVGMEENCRENGGEMTTQGACIVAVGDINNRYYKVITYIYIELPFFGLSMTIPITGETKIIRYY